MAVISQMDVSGRLRRYLEAWHELDADALVSLYRPDASHRGPGVAAFYPERPDATVRGSTDLRDFVGRIRSVSTAVPDFTITWALESDSSSVVEYDVADMDLPLVEIVIWDADQVRQVRAYSLFGYTPGQRG